MIKLLSSILILWLIFTTTAYADQDIKLGFGYQDQYSNSTVVDKVSFKIIQPITSTTDISFRSDFGKARNKDSTLKNYEIGVRYKQTVASGFKLYISPKLATVKISNLAYRNFAGLELGTLLRPFENRKIGFKIDRTWTTGIGNKRSTGMISKFQVTYDVSGTATIGVRYDTRRGSPVEFNTFNIVYGLKI